jgi:hypothetical protein
MKLKADVWLGDDIPLGHFEGVVVYRKGKIAAKVYVSRGRDHDKVAKQIAKAINKLGDLK